MKGNEFMNAKDFQEAVDSYSKSIELNPQEAATYSNRALAYIRLKEFARAIEDANESLKINPNYLKAYHRRAKAYFSMNKFEIAIKDFQHILEVEPENKEAIVDLKLARDKLNERLKSSGA